MFIIQFLLRFIGILLLLVLIFINTQDGKDYMTEMGIPSQNDTIRVWTGLDLDETLSPNDQLNDQRPIYGFFDLLSFFFVSCTLLSYIFLSLNIYELRFLFAHIIISSVSAKKALDNLVSRMKDLSETYYNSGSEAMREVTRKNSVPQIWDLVTKQIEMRIPFEDILIILGNSAALTRKRYDRNIKVIANLSNLSPSIGIMGTVLGLMNTLGNLSDPSNLGPSMSLALLTTFYGLFLSVIIFKPILTHVENMKATEMNCYQAVSFWLRNLALNKPSFYLDQTVQKTKYIL